MKVLFLLLTACSVGRNNLLYFKASSIDPVSAEVAQGALARVIEYYKGCGEPVEAGGDWEIKFAPIMPSYFGLYTGDGILIDSGPEWKADDEACDPSGSNGYLSTTLAHEVGHLLGYQHVMDLNDIMAPWPIACRTIPKTCPADFE